MKNKFEIIYTSKINKQNPIVHLSKTIQNHLFKKGSKIKLDKAIGGELSITHAFIFENDGKGFRASDEFLLCAEEGDVIDFYVIYLTKNKLSVARARVDELEVLSNIVYDWIERDFEIDKMQKKYPKLDVFQPIRGLSEEKSKVWNEIKNFIFRYTNFYIKNEMIWVKPYNEMLEKLSKNPKFDKYTPFTSHYRLHLNDKNKSLKWHYIITTTEEKYQVAEQSTIVENAAKVNEIFDSLDEAMDFYHKLLSKLELEKNKK